MTREHILVLGLDEIRSIRWQCDKCESATSFKLNESISLPQTCHGCGAEYVGPESFSELETAGAFIKALKALQNLANGKKARATLKIECDDARA
jgi:hypothetical protein